MNKMLISKSEFVRTLNEVKIRSDFVDRLYDLNIDIIETPDLQSEVVRLLDLLTNDSDWVAYYCWELDFGKHYKPDSVMIGDVSVDISTPEKLYDMLEKDWEGKE